MRKLLLAAAAAASVGVVPLAALAHASGVIDNAQVQAVNPSAMTVTLKDGEVFNLDNAAQLSQLQPGAQVQLHWIDQGDNYVVTRIDA